MSLRICGNRQIKTLPGLATRPTPSRVREALFNIWQGTIADCRWLDICTGSGSMGAEALCRKAASVTGIEQSAKACAIIRENWEQVADSSQAFQILRGNATGEIGGTSGQAVRSHLLRSALRQRLVRTCVKCTRQPRNAST